MISRKVYRDIKNMNRITMNNYIESIWRSGFKDGVESGNNADFRIELSKILQKTKGIGPKLYIRIMENSKDVF